MTLPFHTAVSERDPLRPAPHVLQRRPRGPGGGSAHACAAGVHHGQVAGTVFAAMIGRYGHGVMLDSQPIVLLPGVRDQFQRDYSREAKRRCGGAGTVSVFKHERFKATKFSQFFSWSYL